MGQCAAKVKSGRQCQKLQWFCSVHGGNIDWVRTAAMVAGGVLRHMTAPGVGRLAAGGLMGNLADRFFEENKAVTKRVFVSFDFDNDKFLKDSIVGQSKNPDSPFTISDWSLKEEQEESNWKDKARARIKRSDIVLVMVGTKTHKASGVLAEVNMARDEEIKIVQIKGYSDKECPKVPNAGRMYKWTWNNLKNLLV